MCYYYLRTLGGRDGAELSVVYVVQTVTREKPDPVPVLAGFPGGWRPTENPGQCLAALGSPPAVLETLVPRSQFRHNAPISKADGLALYPELLG